jgi:hypothetical protein
VAVVSVRSDFCDNVTDSDELVGRLRLVSLLPQYLPVSVSVSVDVILSLLAYLLDHSDVDGSCRCCSMDLG